MDPVSRAAAASGGVEDSRAGMPTESSAWRRPTEDPYEGKGLFYRDDDDGNDKDEHYSKPLDDAPDEKATRRPVKGSFKQISGWEMGTTVHSERASLDPRLEKPENLEAPANESPLRTRAKSLDKGEAIMPAGRWSRTSGPELDYDAVCRPSKRLEMALMAMSTTGGMLMTQWRWPRYENLAMGNGGDLLRSGVHDIQPLHHPWQSHPQFADLLDHPSVLLLGILTNFAALTLYYYLHRGEKYQDVLLIAVVGSSAGLGLLLGLDASAVLLRVTPWAGILALLTSTYGVGVN
ncbi:hypothetical protein QBC33DRAFT_563316 [Phialemonium atrogriseum]|uniref:Uncharacterized protein n=1 Tax=Phialemonium atrogriseum TaxID=1093897 RepID=A0AAJ0BTM7_9PEZI|nr:uncharacterized protein QBC33DRAFT_563316 [Phialemonium atrogriseum]KAK1762904.1 hypothetical protein QBC33DRAFT_563316 [Phialemonium atrogriseum]